MKIEGIPNNQTNLKKDEQSSRTHISQFQNLLQNYCNQNGVLLAWGWAYRLWKRIENSELDAYIYTQLIFDNSVNNPMVKEQEWRQMSSWYHDKN